MDDDVLLMLFDEFCRGRWRNVVKGTIGDCATHFCRDVIGRKRIQALGSGVRNDTGLWRTGVVFDSAPSNYTSHAPNFNPLRRSLIWTKHEQVTLILERLFMLLADLLRPRVGDMRMYGLHN